MKRAGELLKKKIIALNTTIMLGLGSVFSIPAVQAESSVQSQRTEVQSQITEAQELIKDLQVKANKAKRTKLRLTKKRLKLIR